MNFVGRRGAAGGGGGKELRALLTFADERQKEDQKLLIFPNGEINVLSLVAISGIIVEILNTGKGRKSVGTASIFLIVYI